ncbi:MAG: hypothetical protein CMI30_08680 [Opitutae bacterium]|nr:hypothetical protein [Opitutae bacterium]|tara:strand:- start:6754 stop:8184 length:1431 start_codon:yes stop_codon:yes gene_type:complete
MRLALGILSLWLASHATAANLIEVGASAKNDLRDALDRLARQRSTQQSQKAPIVREVNALEGKVIAKRKEFDRRRRLNDNQESSLSELTEEVEEIESDLEAVLALLHDYNQSWLNGISAPEHEFRKGFVQQALASRSEGTTKADPWKDVSPGIALAKLSVERLQESFGGLRFKGKAATAEDNVEEEGSFLVVGPAVYFASSETDSAGIVEHTPPLEPSDSSRNAGWSVNRTRSCRVLATPSDLAETIRVAVTASPDDSIVLPFDPTLGKALVLANSDPSFWEELRKGGFWIFPILGFALISIVIVSYKATQILSIKIPTGQTSWEGDYTKDFADLRNAAQANQGKSAEILEEVLYEQIIQTQSRLEKWLPVVAVTAAAAPLLGLLGTVTGMINVFQQLTHFANPENSSLSRGISEALVTTKFGLATAIPALVAHALLSRRIQAIVTKMESIASGFVSLASEQTANSSSSQEDDGHE